MPFNDKAKSIALAIVKVFETGKPLGNYSAVAVLDDGAGISYGASQFTHKSGSLELVLRRYKILNGLLPDTIEAAWPKIDTATAQNIASLSNNQAVKTALRELGSDPLMQQAQREIAWEKYLKPAIDACEGSNFELPLSLAVIYDSMNHGSYGKIRDQVKVQPLSNGSMKPEEFEKEWITEYVRRRDRWLESVPRLAKTGYRTDFFLAQIAKGNWKMDLPMNVHGYRLTNASLAKPSAAAPTLPEKLEDPTATLPVPAEAPPKDPGTTQIAENIVNAAPPPAPMPNVVIEKRKEEGWLATKWKQILGLFTAGGALDGITERAQALQTFGMSSDFWRRMFYVAAGAAVIWLISDWWKHRSKIKEEIAKDAILARENSTELNFVQFADTEYLQEYRNRGYKVITR